LSRSGATDKVGSSTGLTARNKRLEKTMKYEAIQDQISKARIQQSVVLGELIAEAIVAAWSVAGRVAGQLRSTIEGTTDYLPRSQA
jgi:hypothetical protein